MTAAGSIQNTARVLYESWTVEMVRQGEAAAGALPDWDGLTAEQVLDWTAVYAATIEVSYRMARAISGLGLGRAVSGL